MYQCGACIAGCESDAITEGETQSHMDINKCVECGACERNCPVDAVIYVDDEEYKAQVEAQMANSS